MSILTGDNLLGNLVSFIMLFIESSIKTAQNVKLQAEKQMKRIGGVAQLFNEEDEEIARRIKQA